MKLAKASLIPKAVRLARRILHKARHDVKAVQQAIVKVKSRSIEDQNKIDDSHSRRQGDRRVRDFAQGLISKWENVHKLAFQEQKPSPSAHKTEVLERRIAALEAALRAAGGEVSQMERSKMAANFRRINKEIALATKKLKLMKEKTTILKQLEAESEKKGQKSAQIKAGAEERDLSVHIEQVQTHLQSLYQKLSAAKKSAEKSKASLLPANVFLPAVERNAYV